MMRFTVLVATIALWLVSLGAIPATAADVVPLPTGKGYQASDTKQAAAEGALATGLNDPRPAKGLNGVVKVGRARRPTISTVRVLGATTCRSAGIVPPLGFGRFGEPGIGGLPICPSAPGQAASAPPPPTPFEAAYYTWLFIVNLPSPTASTQPTVGITGLDTFLTIQGQQGMVLDVPVMGYNVHFDITSVYDVDWGDPRPDGSRTGAAVTRNSKDQGGPYPSGTLRHQYIERGSATISITQRWSATWSAAGDGGSLPDSVETTGSLILPIHEIQGVVTG